MRERLLFEYNPHPLDEKEWKALEKKHRKFPFDLPLAIDRICGDECGAFPFLNEKGEEINPCPGKCDCRYYQNRIEALKELHTRVAQARHVGVGDVADADLCEKCAFGSVCTVSHGTMWEPPEMGLWCDACQALVEDCECHGTFFMRVTDSENIGDIEPEELR